MHWCMNVGEQKIISILLFYHLYPMIPLTFQDLFYSIYRREILSAPFIPHLFPIYSPISFNVPFRFLFLLIFIFHFILFFFLFSFIIFHFFYSFCPHSPTGHLSPDIVLPGISRIAACL